WSSHYFSTPHAPEAAEDLTRWATTGAEPPAWRQRFVVFVAADRGQDTGRLPWITADSHVERSDGWLLVARPAPGGSGGAP
ncbi:MAG TPA: hypothetical protein VJL84_07420, partial [Kiloniellales bacterium]|nr:hypothetical protein [Kiloniellales bacterium]